MPCPALSMTVVVAPSRGRGLKPVDNDQGDKSGGRPFTGAWIETAYIDFQLSVQKSPLHGGVD